MNRSFRHFSSFLKSRVTQTYKLALQGHQQHLNRLKHPTEAPEIDPALLSYGERVASVFAQKSTAKERRNRETSKALPALESSLKQRYSGEKLKHEWNQFGTISVHHNCIFQSKTDLILIPITPNFLPHEGIGLLALERGGEEMVQQVFIQVKAVLDERMAEVKAARKILENPDRGGSPEYYEQALANAQQMTPGDLVFVPTCNDAAVAPTIAFLVLPYAFQGSAAIAAQTLRSSIQQAFKLILNNQEIPHRSISLPLLGNGIHGYKPSRSANILIEECIETLLQLDAVVPDYTCNEFRVVCEKSMEAKQVCTSLGEAASAWLPEFQTVTSLEYLENQRRRIVKIPPAMFKHLFTAEKYFFKKHGFMKGMKISTYRGGVRPYVWRPYRVRPAPPMHVYRTTGAPARVVSGPSRCAVASSVVAHRGVIKMRVNRGEWTADTSRPMRATEIRGQ